MKLETYAARADDGVTEALAPYKARVWADANGKLTIARTFDTLAEWANVMIEPGHEGVSTHRTKERNEWATGGDTLAEVLEMANGKGWDAVNHELETMIENVESLTDAQVMRPNIEFAHDLSGGAVDVAAYLAGEAENMIQIHFEPSETSGKVVRIIVPMVCSGSIDQLVMRRRGIAIAALLNSLIKANYTLEVWAVQALHGHKATGAVKRFAHAIKIQSAGENVDPLMIAFGVGHPAMLRKLAFLVEEHENDNTRRMFGFQRGMGYGTASYAACLEDLPEWAQHGPTIVLPELNSREARTFATDANVAAWINQQVSDIKSGKAVQVTDENRATGEYGDY